MTRHKKRTVSTLAALTLLCANTIAAKWRAHKNTQRRLDNIERHQLAIDHAIARLNKSRVEAAAAVAGLLKTQDK